MVKLYKWNTRFALVMENILFIEGYANQLSVEAGKDIDFHISTNI